MLTIFLVKILNLPQSRQFADQDDLFPALPAAMPINLDQAKFKPN
jgi:hypothetical protein